MAWFIFELLAPPIKIIGAVHFSVTAKVVSVSQLYGFLRKDLLSCLQTHLCHASEPSACSGLSAMLGHLLEYSPHGGFLIAAAHYI